MKSQEFLDKLAEIAAANLEDEQFGISELAKKMNMTRVSLYRKIKSSLKISASQYLRNKRLEKAIELLRHTSCSVSEAAYKSGFGSVTYFHKCFHDYYGYPPGKIAGHPENIPPDRLEEKFKSRRWSVLAAIAMLFFLVLAVAVVLNNSNLNESKGKVTNRSIAVLPLHFEGTDSMRILAGGFLEAVINHFMDIENLSVRSKMSDVQFNTTTRSLKEIAKDLNVDFIFEVTGYQAANSIRFQVNLLDAVSDRYLMRAPYVVDIENEDFLNAQNRIASDVLSKTKITLSPRERENLVKRLTNNPAAYYFYLKGLKHDDLRVQMETLSNADEVRAEVLKAKEMYEKALHLDAGFTDACVRLGAIYMDYLSFTDDAALKNAFIDSGLVLTEKTIALYDTLPKDRNYSQALILKSRYYWHKGDLKRSEYFFDQALKAPIPYDYGSQASRIFAYAGYDKYYLAIESFYRYLEAKPPDFITPPHLIRVVCSCLYYIGFPEVAEKYYRESLLTNSDTLHFYYFMSINQFLSGNFNSAIDYGVKACSIDSFPDPLYAIAYSQLLRKEYKAALKTVEAGEKLESFYSNWTFNVLTGYVFQVNGQQDKANLLYKEALEFGTREIESGTLLASRYMIHMNLAVTYSAMGENQKALEYLKALKNRETIPRWILVVMELFPMMDGIRSDPEFQEIKKALEKKYTKEHERVAKLLKEKEELDESFSALR